MLGSVRLLAGGGERRSESVVTVGFGCGTSAAFAFRSPLSEVLLVVAVLFSFRCGMCLLETISNMFCGLSRIAG